VLVILAVVVAAIPLILSNWGSLLQLINGTAKSSRKLFKLHGQASKGNEIHDKQGGEEICERSIPWPLKNTLALKERFPPHRYRRADLRSSWDLEMGYGGALNGYFQS
jgi:hypothetical protein